MKSTLSGLDTAEGAKEADEAADAIASLAVKSGADETDKKESEVDTTTTK